jgi:hypothetical protein
MMNPDHPDGRPHAVAARTSGRVSAGQLLVLLRRHRIPCSIDSLSPGGWTARLGDPAQGAYSQQGHFPSRDAAAEWLLGEVERRAHSLRR